LRNSWEVRAKWTLDHIALLTRPKTAVLRDGREQQIEPGALVVGDILVVRPGEQIVADGPVVINYGRVEVDKARWCKNSTPSNRSVMSMMVRTISQQATVLVITRMSIVVGVQKGM